MPFMGGRAGEHEREMLLDDPIQLIIVGAIVVVFFVMGPKKIPELARALGQARGEFTAGSAQKPGGLTNLVTTLTSPAATATSGNAQLIETAERLGIPTEGKTPAEIADAIVAKANSNK